MLTDLGTEGKLASLPPHLLRAYQDPASVLAWNQDQNQPDPNQANLIQAGEGPASQLPAPSQPAPPAPGWEDPAAHHLKQLYYNWRPRMAELMQLSSGHRNRFDGRHVETRVNWAIPVNLVHVDPGRGARHTWMQKTIADLALRADRLMQLSSLRWEFQFTEPNGPGAGPTSGFAYDDSQGCMDLHWLQWDQQPRAPGRAVDHVVRPLLRCYTLDPDARRWDKLLHVRPMQVCMHGKGRKVPVPAPVAGGNPANAGNAGNSGNAGNP
ncbi:hypothetical protein C8A01DRAFT_15947 [Parachaetomium inaequale]|uniref:Uncharacterized protein n=1 Tax=Parachaetomium inaequale TaxID=2588326 RepID=A0AAN6SS91_9PEZI|nr:hypothetical protein C8A01DRAFT_15947 [Parachaetomium inaequale]